MTLTLDQKAAALAGLAELHVVYREKQWRVRSGSKAWYVLQHVEIKDGPMLSGDYGNGWTPEAAIEDHWRRLVDELPPGKYLVLHAGDPEKRRAVRWNGFMWETITEEKT